MELTIERAKENLAKLIAKFERELATGRIKDYLEETTKTGFIQPLLKDVLGWDVNNIDDVSPEEKVSHGRVDYGLKVDGVIKVFIESKAIREDLNKHIEQAVRYGYNKKSVPFVLLTDFEGIKLFDVTVKPDSRNLLKGLKLDLDWKDYLKQFDKLWLLSKESVVKGELDKLLLVKPKDRLPVDKAILDDLKRWRVSLAKDIFKNNHHLFHSGDSGKDANYLKEITQRILDRIIFMRSCEDRSFIYRSHLKELFEERTETVGTNTMLFLKEEFKHYNIIFDSDLFRPQEWEKNLAIDFIVIRDIIMDTYNPYQFDVIPSEVLGNIYEQYLGYTIRLTDHQVRYELKPDVRKAGGVYYTPEYIVDYIVKNTIGKLLQELPPKKIKKLRILDPACGSGSFLIRAYEEMMNYYRNQKKKHQPKSKEGQRKLELKHAEVEPLLSIHEKSAILRDHIFGVDIDEQAVEVTKLSLMLKMLEGEFGIIPGRSILPMLDRNIRCGNSLISGDTLELKKYFGDDWYKVKPFNWKDEFRKIMKEEGGFDVVIGNPPYVQLSMEENLKSNLKKYLVKKYESSMGRLNTFGFFTKLGIELLREKGHLGFIIPNTILTQDYYEKLRIIILDNCVIKSIVSFENLPFKDAVIENIILILENVRDKSRRKRNKVKIYDVNENYQFIEIRDITQGLFNESHKRRFNINLNERTQLLKNQLETSTKKLGEFLNINQAIAIKHDRAKYLSGKKLNNQYKRVLDGRYINRYSLNWNNKYLKYDVKAIHSCKREDIFVSKEKLFFRRVGDRLIATYDDSQFYALNTLVVMNLRSGVKYDLKYFLSLFNSSALNFYYQVFLKSTKKVFSEIQARQVAQLPICTINFSNPAEKELHDDLVALVDVMLDLNKKIQTAKGSEKDQLQRQIEKTDREIDNLVYKLYGITEEEREIIEGTS